MVNVQGLESYGNVKRHGAMIWLPQGTVGHAEEIEFVEFVHAHAAIGYGRMVQMIDEMRAAAEKQRTGA